MHHFFENIGPLDSHVGCFVDELLECRYIWLLK